MNFVSWKAWTHRLRGNEISLRSMALCLAIGSQACASPVSLLAPTERVLVTDIDYTHAHRLVNVGGSRSMNLFCAGTGSPTVVFDADAGSAGWDWVLVHPMVATHTQACVYDRAGLGFSDPASGGGTSGSAVSDLHRLLFAANIKPPFVLVGQGYGGLNVELYAATHPDEVSGLVLVDPTDADEGALADHLAGGAFSRALVENDVFLRHCAESASSAASGTEPLDKACGESQRRSPFGPALGKTVLDSAEKSSFWIANRAEEVQIRASSDQLHRRRRSFGSMSVIILTRGVGLYDTPGKAPSGLSIKFEQQVGAMRDALARLSSRGVNRVVSGSGHDVHIDRPKAVVDAIDEVLAPLKPKLSTR